MKTKEHKIYTIKELNLSARNKKSQQSNASCYATEYNKKVPSTVSHFCRDLCWININSTSNNCIHKTKSRTS